MTKAERIKSAVSGQMPDKTPYAFWTHFPDIDTDPEAIAQKTVEFYNEYKFDFVKTMNNGFYTAEAFGCAIDAEDVKKGGVAKITSTPIAMAQDLFSLKAPEESADVVRARELRHLELVLEGLKNNSEDVPPVIFTTFTPLTTLDKICGSGKLLGFMENKENEAAIHAALDVITRWTMALSKAAIDMGAAGIFLASQMSSYDKCTYEQYVTFGRPYDERVLEAVKDGWLNTIHCHGNRIMFDILKEYDVDAFNWHAWETLPDIDEAFDFAGKCLMGGIDRRDIPTGNKEGLQNQIYRCIKTMKGHNLILTPGCVIRYPLNETAMSFINTVRDDVDVIIRREAK